ncbi:tudor domain-containing protein 1-like isoform X1 [Ptychodera flava]|uniref:tudor domain-containing protein 1-like isoform X1 n=1 Tax=Ptychodera flava TaxID=63121 RepID=UPI00396AA371
MDHSFDLFSIPDSPPISVYPILKWPGAETDRTAIPSHRLKFLVDGGNSPQPQEKYRMPFLSATPVKSQAESRKTPSPSSSGESEDQKVGDWNPMKEDFMSTSFNSYDKGPGANLVGAGAPKQVLQASSSDKVSSEEPEMHQVYVRGIPKEMQEEALFNIFSKAGKVKEVSIKGASLFHTGQSGYGFVTFSSVKEVENAIRLIDGFRINNCALSVQPCAPRSERERRKSGKESLDGTPEKQRSGSLSSQGYDGRGTPRRDSNCSSDSSVDGHLKTPQSVSPGSLGRLSPGVKSPVGLGVPRNGMDSSGFGNSPSTTWNEKDEKADVSLGKVTVSGDVRRVILNHGSNSKEEPSPGVHHGTPGKQSPLQQSAKTDSPVSKKGKDGGCPRPCMYCKKAGVMFCSRCKGPYCSHECQKKHWPEHRAMCKPDLYKPKSDGTSPSAAKQLNMTEGESLAEHANHPQNTPKSSKQSVAGRKDHNYQAIPEDPAFEVLVTDVVSPDVVWCQIARESNVTALSSLMVLMNQFYSDPNTVTEDCIPQKGDIVAAQFSADGGWYRAEVKEINTDGHVHMHFVDFGNEEGMPKSRLRNLTKEMRDLPFQALKCCVAGIAPVNGQVGWSTDAVQVMKSKILNKKCLVQYEKQVTDVHHLWICDPNDQHGSTVNDFMVKAQHAQKKTNNNSPQQSPPQPQQGKLQRQPVMVTDLPPKDVAKTGCFPVMCSYVENPGSFYVQIVDQDELKELSGIMEKMNGMCREIAYTPFQPKVGELVCAFYNTDNCWYRAVVKEVQQNQVLVQYADFGNSEVIPTSLLREYKDAKLPLQAIHCKLAGTTAVNEETGWSQSAKEFFCT